MIKCPHCKKEVESWGEINTFTSIWKLDNKLPRKISGDYPDNTVYFCPICNETWDFSFAEILAMLKFKGGEPG